jgi:hypothetical protein
MHDDQRPENKRELKKRKRLLKQVTKKISDNLPLLFSHIYLKMLDNIDSLSWLLDIARPVPVAISGF